jgi:hypothetical protein
VDGKVLSWHKDSSIENARVIESREENLYRLLEQNEEALVHDEVNPNELWHISKISRRIFLLRNLHR